MPIVSAIMPLYQGIRFLRESIQSIQKQTLCDWEFLIITEPDQEDGSIELIQDYIKTDSRIRLIQNERKLGLAASLNRGIREAVGSYIARVDVDDPSYPERFMKQVDYLDANHDVFLCGSLTRSVLPDKSYILEVPCDQEELKAALLFGCEISHCTVMFRRQEFIDKGYFYDESSLCEDYALWTRIMFEERLVNLPEVLVDHRWGFDNISIQKGKKLLEASQKVSAETLHRFNISITDDQLPLVSGWRSRPEEIATRAPSQFLRDSFFLLDNLRNENNKCLLIDSKALDRIIWKRWNWACDCCGIFYPESSFDNLLHEEEEPEVSIIMPVYQAAKTIRESIDSIRNQDFVKYEFLVLCEAGNSDGSTELAKMYEYYDKRIHVIENKEKLGLAATLNYGIHLAKGKYIARIDADDLSNRLRLSTQVSFMDNNPSVGFSQFYQHYFGQTDDKIHRPALTSEELKTRLLFFCDATHSTVMIRKEVLETNHLYYDELAAIEDYELWTRLIKVTDFATIPEVYGEYRVSASGISQSKTRQIHQDMAAITARQLKENLGMTVSEKDQYLLGSYFEPISLLSDQEKKNGLEELHRILHEIRNANKKKKYYKDSLLTDVLTRKWRWSQNGIFWDQPVTKADVQEFLGDKKTEKIKMKKILLKPLKMIQRMNLHLHAKSIEHLSRVMSDVTSDQTGRLDKSAEKWTWDRFVRLENRLNQLEQENHFLRHQIIELAGNRNYIPYLSGEIVRIVFLFQIASFWPGWESFYQACRNDKRFDVKLLFLDETNSEASQMLTAEQFLQNSGLEYQRFEDFDIDSFQPHIIVIQTPYDRWHRQSAHYSSSFRLQGYRIIYIPYGVEISDTEESHHLHFEEDVILNAWRIFTLSDLMKRDYYKYCANRRAVRALGLPRFDYYSSEKQTNGSQKEYLKEKALGRQIVLWKVHFPKQMRINGIMTYVTPDYKEYLQFAKRISDFKDLFVVFLPHPKFFEKKLWGNDVHILEEMMNTLYAQENVYVELADDYRPVVTAADFIILDRSAVMVEAGACGVPVLYMHNSMYDEKMTEAIQPLVESYYQGTTVKDMIQFVEMCKSGEDPLFKLRENAFKKCVPMFDGMAGERICNEIAEALLKEGSHPSI